MRKILLIALMLPLFAAAQLKWKNVDPEFGIGPLPSSVHVYFTNQPLDTAPFRAYYVVADLQDKKLEFATDTSAGRRLTPSKFYEKNGEPLVVVNATFFSFETNANLNLVINNGKLLSPSVHSIPGRGKDTFTYRHPFPSAIGISKKAESRCCLGFDAPLVKTAHGQSIQPSLP